MAFFTILPILAVILTAILVAILDLKHGIIQTLVDKEFLNFEYIYWTFS